MYAKWLDESWKEFFDERDQTQVTKSFKCFFMLNARDGSEDKETKVQRIENYEILNSSDEDDRESDSDSESSSQIDSSSHNENVSDSDSDSDSDDDNESDRDSDQDAGT